MPSGDMTHPIPDLTGYITEGQIVLDRELERRGISPPIAVLPSLSRLMGDSIGPAATREDHEPVARQLYAACARASRARALEGIIGSEELSEVEQAYLRFADVFEQRFLSQGPEERRGIGETLDRGWEALAVLPESEKGRLPAALRAARKAGA